MQLEQKDGRRERFVLVRYPLRYGAVMEYDGVVVFIGTSMEMVETHVRRIGAARPPANWEWDEIWITDTHAYEVLIGSTED